MVAMAGMKIGAHVELFKRDEITGAQVLVSTTRPCRECGEPVEGLVVPDGESFVHPECRTNGSRI
jgi:hypothetical protein